MDTGRNNVGQRKGIKDLWDPTLSLTVLSKVLPGWSQEGVGDTSTRTVLRPALPAQGHRAD